MKAFWMPNIRTVRATPPPPGSRPRVTSGRPIWHAPTSAAMRWWRGQRDLQAAAERGAVDGGDDRLAERLQPAQVGLDGLDQVERLGGVRPGRA